MIDQDVAEERTIVSTPARSRTSSSASRHDAEKADFESAKLGASKDADSMVVEKAHAQAGADEMSFPEGGLKAWTVVFGA